MSNSSSSDKSIFERMQEFTSEMEKSQASTSTSRKHIRFNDDAASEREEGEVSSPKRDQSVSQLITSDESSRADDDRHICTLRRDNESESYGFEINGKANVINEHFISNVAPNSPAHLAGLRKYDKIVTINGKSVMNKYVNQIIKMIEVETRQSANRLEFIVTRSKQVPNEADMQSKMQRKRVICKYYGLIETFLSIWNLC